MSQEERTALRAPRTGWLWLLGVPLLAWALLHPRGVAVEVAGKSWRREIEIERRVLEMHSEPCAQMPAEAQKVERRLQDGTEHCRFLAPVWRKRRWVVAEGDAAPHWPALDLLEGERAGRRHARQLLLMRDADGRQWDCELPLAEWQRWQPGARTRLAVHRFSGVADCSSLSVS